VVARWRIGVLATSPETFDANIGIEQSDGLLTIALSAHESGSHFSGYVSPAPFDLSSASIAAEVRRPAAGGATTIFAAAANAANWLGFRLEGGKLLLESHTDGRVVSKSIPYDPVQHRHLRLRQSDVAAVVVWETSPDGISWTPLYVETTGINVSALHIVLSGGTRKSIPSSSTATFAGVTVERKP
jgi:hypothetical protein